MTEEFIAWFKEVFSRTPGPGEATVDHYMWLAWSASRERLEAPLKKSALTDNLFGD